MENIIKTVLSLVIIVCFDGALTAQTNFIYGKQFGTELEDEAHVPVCDSKGNLYLAGNTKGNLAAYNQGNGDGFIASFDAEGNTLWKKQFGTEEEEHINSITIDPSANLYITGFTKGSISKKNEGAEDILLVKCDGEGHILWQKQFGTDSTDIGNAIYSDAEGNIYVTGITRGNLQKTNLGKTDGFLLKTDTDGKMLFMSQFGTSEDDNARGIAGDELSNIYLCGSTFGKFEGANKGAADIFVAMFNDKGKQMKSYQVGTDNFDIAMNISIDINQNIYLGGFTYGVYNSAQIGEGDALLIKMNQQGDIIWSDQFGTNKWDGINGMDFNESVSENIVVSGCQNFPECQSFCRVYSPEGKVMWKGNYIANGEGGGTCGKGICLNTKGFIYHLGGTGGNLFNTAMGKHDVYVVKLELDKELLLK